jgi:hypothetical protein
MTKYARMVFEVDIEDEATEDEIESRMYEHMTDYLTVEDLEISEIPYTKE